MHAELISLNLINVPNKEISLHIPVFININPV